ncbi:MAG: DUF72 domain-containing protein [Bacteroidetes bacterium]|nr:DUF72 domain-containing protein [Bacteroidota bacterium]
MKKGKVYIGTSGWHYKHWKQVFYPPDLPEADQLAYYAQFFGTVEINNSFYMLPDRKTFTAWKKATPPGFFFSVKGSRFITHMKKLKADKASVKKFMSHAGGLGEKLGPVLFQLPPRWRVNVERLREFLQRLPHDHRYAFEFREHSWYTKEVYQALEQYNCAFCIYELEHHLSPLEVTASYIYVRLHGPGNKYQGSYPDSTLRTWARRIKKWRAAGKDVYVYFDNDQAGYAVTNAKRLRTMVK